MAGTVYTNTRPSKVSVAGVHFNSGKQATVPEEHVAALEAKDKGGSLTHPLRRGPNPILVPGQVALPAGMPRTPSVNLDALDEVKAMAQVRLCQDLEILASWAANERRPSIVEAITKRAGELPKK